MRTLTAVAALLAVAACSPEEDKAKGELPPGPDTTILDVDAAELPPALLPVIEAAMPGMKIVDAERKEREGRVYYDIEGTRADGSEVELDILAEGEAFRVVEVQRDIDWAAAPAEAVAAAKAAGLSFTPARVIESRQVADGSVILELFAPDAPEEPAMEVRLVGGKAEVLTERAPH